ncbi:MAG TPA: hypothetical protein VEJ68_05885 [Candidatus Bathyarchaeia archaeon]|nr:hypothetical protein [Candidatus Bathyarchaeia archaeon]
MTEFVFSPVTSIVFLVSQIAIVIVAVFLSAIAIRAYKITRLKNMIFVIIAFALFAVSHTISYLDQAVVDIMPDDARYAMFGVVEIGIMMMFVLAILKK